MIKILLVTIMLLPGAALAESACRVIEFPDHSEIDCVEDEQSVKAAAQNNNLPQAVPIVDTIIKVQPDGSAPFATETYPTSTLYGSTVATTSVAQSANLSYSQPTVTVTAQNPNSQAQGGQQYKQSNDSSSLEFSQKPPVPNSSSGNQTVTQQTLQTVQQPSGQIVTLHRQGRQQYQQSLEQAKAARTQMILDNQLQQSPQ